MVKADLRVPGDKSISHRAVMLGALARGETVIRNYLASADCLATIDCFRKLGIKISVAADELRVAGQGLEGLKETRETLDVANSGTTIRLISGILAGQSFTTKITGDASIRRRPMGRIAKPLRAMGASVEGQGYRVKGQGGMEAEIYAPLKISGGQLTAIDYELPVASAQVKSAVLLAGLFAQGETSVIEKNQSRDHTERMLEHFGAGIRITNHESRITGQKEFDGSNIDVPGDISSAAFFMVAGLILPQAEITLREIGVNPTRTGIIEVLHRMGADLTVENERIVSGEPRAEIIVRSSRLKGIKISGEIIPRLIDEIPIIAVAATQADGVTEIRGAKELRVKESDRIATIAAELRKLGAKIEELDDGLIIHGPTKLKGAEIESHGDHRIAMSAAIAGLITDGKTHVIDTACIDTSFPGFESLLNKLK